MMTIGSGIGRALVPVAVALVFGLARKWMPAPAAPTRYIPESDDIVDNGSASGVTVNSAVVLVMLVIGFGGHALLDWLNRTCALLDGPAELRLYPQPAIWWLLPGFGALALGYEIVLRIWIRTPGGYSMMEYDKLSSQKVGFDGRRMLLWMAILIVGPGAIFTVLAIPEHVSLGSTVIVERGYGFKGARSFRYEDAQRLTAIRGFRNRDGSLTDRAGLVVDFKDGSSWSSASWGDFKKTIDPQLVQLLERKTGLPLQQKEALEDATP